MEERYPVYALADLSFQSREIPHDKIVDEIVAVLAEHMGCANDLAPEGGASQDFPA